MRHVDRRCLVAPVPGFGQPARRDWDLSPPALAAGLLTDLNALRLPPAVLVGHSSSCQVVAEAAAAAPGRVAGLVLIGPTTDPAANTWGRLVIRWLRTARHERPSMIPSLTRQYARTGLVAMFRAMDAARCHEITAAVATASAPVLVLRGTHDRIATRPWVDEVARLGNGQARTLPAGAHMVVMTHGPLVAAAMRAHLRHHGL